MKTKNYLKLLVAVVMAVNYVNINSSSANSFSVIEVKDAKASGFCVYSDWDTCIEEGGGEWYTLYDFEEI